MQPFLWGAATSSHQVEGNNRTNDWWAWEQAGKVKEASGTACDQYRLFREDIGLIERLGHNAHRFSIEWSRLEPEEDRWDEEAFRHYETLLKTLRERRIEPVVTLHHFTNPQWFAGRGGWLSPQAVFYFARYVRRVLERFAPYVRYWITINEPLIYLYYGYYEGLWPPGKKSYPEGLRVFRQMLRTHLESYRLIHNHYKKNRLGPAAVSVSKHMMFFEPCRKDSCLDRTAVWLRHWFFNHLFFSALQTGFLFFPGMFCEFLPFRGALDFLGVNYYARDFIRFAGWDGDKAIGSICDKEHHRDAIRETNMMGWDVWPEGFYRLLKGLKRYHLPVMVTENGICTLDDEQRRRYITEHLRALKRARDEGIPVIGYFYWSLLDNFEWAHGYEPRFGIVEVDYRTQERKIRPSAQVLADQCRNIGSKG